MSLLLDALKKAADEKKKSETATAGEAEVETIQVNRSEAENQKETDPKAFDLTLDESALHSNSETEEYEQLSSALAGKKDRQQYEAEREASANRDEQQRPQVGSGVSDEALELLVNKTNSSYRNRRRLWVVMISIASISVLTAGGWYFFQDMQTELGYLETRHKQALHSVREKTSQEKLPEKSDIIINLVGDGELKQKVAFTRAKLEKEAVRRQSEKKKTEASKSEPERIKSEQIKHSPAERKLPAQKKSDTNRRTNVSPEKGALSIQKNSMDDPVSVALDNAWMAYNHQHYQKAEKLYRQVLKLEADNRDALLGLGAIAIQNKRPDEAKSYYFSVLEKRPGDPDAIASLASLSNSGQAEGNESYLKRLLEKNPESSTLNFALANVYAGQKRWKLAQENYFKAWLGEKSSPLYCFNLAVSLDQLGKTREAKKFYEDSLRLAENNPAGFSRQAVKKRLAQIQKAGN